MTLGSRTRGVASGLAILTIVALSGCHAMPLSRLEDNGPNRSKSLASASRATLLPATVAMDPPSEMSSIEPVMAHPANLTPAVSTDPAPTPLLDAALLKTKVLDAPPVLEPTPTPAEPQTPPPSALFTNPLPIELPTTPPKNDAVAATSTSGLSSSEASTSKEPEPARPEDLWRDGVRKLNSLAHAKLELGGESSTTPWALRARVLAWLAEPDIDPDGDHHEAEGVRTVLRALDDPPGDSPRKGAAVRSAVLVLEDKAPLEIVDLKLVSRVDGFGDFDAFDPPVRKAGQPVAVYCEIDGLRFEQTAAGFRTRLSGKVEVIPEAGGPPVLIKQLAIAEETCRRRRRDYYIAYKFDLPKPLPAGDYRLRLTEKDLSSDHTATREMSFCILKD